MDAVFIIGIFLSFFLFLLLLRKKGKSLPDKVLAWWILVMGLHLLSYYLYYLDFWTRYPHLVGVTAPFPLLHGPLLYLYTLFSLRPQSRIRYRNYLHFVPAALVYIYLSRFYFFYSAEQKALLDMGAIDDFAVFTNLVLASFVISGITYPVMAYRLMGNYRKLIDANFSYDERISLNWLKYSIWWIGLLFLIVAVVTLLRDGLGYEFGFNVDLVFYSMIVLFIFGLGYSGIRHRDIFSDNTGEESIVEPKTPGEYKNSGLDSEKAFQFHQELLKYMKDQKPFLEPKLTLGNLSQSLGLSANHLSQVINQYEGVNFHDFVNKHRVEEFKKLAADPYLKHFNILALALDAGFNSKSSFNMVFKKHEGQTPSQFINEFNA
ncbi:MAG: AraC family transcriptional regulator [Bacteroidetes bacterium]|nr:MAG: AraC family transcriptional regulator [Bacteroidota bacterium]